MLGPLRWLFFEQLAQVDDDVIGAHGDRAAEGAADLKAHDRLVDGAYLLDLEGSVGDPLAVQDEQVLEHPVEHAVGDPRRGESLAHHPQHPVGPALQEGVGVRVEELAAALGQLHLPVRAAVVNQAEEGEEAGPGAVALVHRVGVEAGVGAELLEEAGDPVVLGVGGLLRHHPPLFSVEEEDQAHQRGHQAAVDPLRIVAGDVTQEGPLDRVVGSDKPTKKLAKGPQDLLGELGRDLVLVLAALGEERRQAAIVGEGEEARRPEEELKGAEDRPAVALRHRLDREGQVARGLAPRSVNQADRAVVDEEADRHAGLGEEPL